MKEFYDIYVSANDDRVSTPKYEERNVEGRE